MLKSFEKFLIAIVTLIAIIAIVLYMSFLSKRDKELIESIPNNTSVVWIDWEE